MTIKASSWRHTPFRKINIWFFGFTRRSWRHTPFRNASSLCALLANSGNSVTLSANSDGKTVIYKSLNNDQQFINETITWDDIWDFLSTSLFSRIV